MRSAARRLDMALAAHAVGCNASPRGSLARTPRVGGRGRWDESPTRGVSIRRRAFSSEAPATFPDAPPPVTHLLTAYDMNAAPTMQVTPLRLEGMGAELPGELGSRLWRAIRLARDVRGEGSGAGSAPELFAPAPRSWGEGVALRLGARGAVTDAVEASLRAENDGNRSFARLVEEPARPLDLSTSSAIERSDRNDLRAAYAALLREALYAHAATEAAFAGGFEVSRIRDCGVRFLETRAETRPSADAADAAAEASFETATRVDDVGDGFRLVASARGFERRSRRTVRDLLDDPEDDSARSGLEVVALGGPSLAGALLLEGDEGAPAAGAVGDPRPELSGDSLLEYHRKRYPARVELLRGADPRARAVWLVPGSSAGDAAKREKAFGAFGGPMAYPAELLAPRRAKKKEEAETSGDEKKTFSAVSPSRIQERVTCLRAALGQPFVRVLGPDARLADRMTRLPEPARVASGPCGKIVPAGSVASGPARAPRADVDAEREPRLVLVPAYFFSLRGGAPPADGADRVEALRARLADGVATAHEAWSVPSAATRATRDDLRAAEAVTDVRAFVSSENFSENARTATEEDDAEGSDPDPATRLARVLRAAARAGSDRVLVETGGSAALESVVRRACASARLPAPRACAFEASARELALELGATRGGQASAFPGFAAAEPKNNLLADPGPRDEDAARGTVFVGVAGVPSLAWRGGENAECVVVAVVDEDAAVLYDGARARRLRARRAREPDEVSNVSASYASASRLAGAAAAAAALEAVAPRTPSRLVAHHDGPSHPSFAEAFCEHAHERGVPSADVVDVEREPSSATGRVLRWDARNGVDAPERGLTWALTETRAVAVTAGDAPPGGWSDAERQKRREGDASKETFLARPLFLRRVAGATDALTIAREVVALAETRVDGFGGAHAMPVTLGGGGRQTRVVMV